MPELTSAGFVLAGQLALAGLTGLAIGIEREWSGHSSGPQARFGGVRTFLLLGLIGGIGGMLVGGGWLALGAALIGAAALLAVLAYVVASVQTGDRDGTTEAAALLVLATGSLCGLGYAALGSGVAAVAVLALAEKGRIRAFVARIGEQELQAALRFAVLATVVLPLLPEGPFGPHSAFRPRELWTIVLLFSGLNFLGYLARRAAGPDRGYGIAGLLGGLVSSTAVALTFARKSREEAGYARSLALGVLAACTVLIPRILVITLVLSPAVAAELAPYVVPPLLLGGLFLAWSIRRSPRGPASATAPETSPLRLVSAIQMAIAFQGALLLVPVIQNLWGSAGVLSSAAILGLTDMDALTYSMARLGSEGDAPLAARAIAVGLVANTGLKLMLVLSLGSPAFRRAAAPGLLALAVAVATGLALVS
ncbi:MAG TPA: DUF4010 domain-containing protein [Gemmatimonadales bacterium]|nr:DUF4010 domain-containing protein [Gemmatimonadales bacterium]